jgi:hypothetical protein
LHHGGAANNEGGGASHEASVRVTQILKLCSAARDVVVAVHIGLDRREGPRQAAVWRNGRPGKLHPAAQRCLHIVLRVRGH